MFCCIAASAVIDGRPPSTSTLLCTSGCRAHRRWPSNPTALSTQRSLIRAARSSCTCMVGNTVNTRGDRWHNRPAEDWHADRIVYSPYNGNVHSPWDGRQNSHIMLYTYGDGNKHGGMAGRTIVCRISVIRERRRAHFSPISQDGHFPTRIVS